jgi:hypothetical protein
VLDPHIKRDLQSLAPGAAVAHLLIEIFLHARDAVAIHIRETKDMGFEGAMGVQASLLIAKMQTRNAQAVDRRLL